MTDNIPVICRAYDPETEAVEWTETTDADGNRVREQIVVPLEVDALAADALARINRDAQAQMDAISAKYPPFEVLTWPDQEREARAWLTDDAASTPTLTPIAEARSMEMAELIGRVIAKADAYRAEVAACVGRRQKLEDDIAAAREAGDPAALAAIQWPAS